MSASPNVSRYQKRQNFLIRFGLLLWFSNAILLPACFCKTGRSFSRR